MRKTHYSLFVLSLILGSAITTAAIAQGQNSTYTYTERVTRVEPATGATESHSTTTTTRITDGVLQQPVAVSPNYDHTYYTYSDKYQAPVLNYGGIEEPVIVDNGDNLTPIRTLAE